MYPAGGPPKADNWTMETFLKAAKTATRAVPLRASVSARRSTASIPPAQSSSHSAAELVDAKGNLTVKTDAVRSR